MSYLVVPAIDGFASSKEETMVHVAGVVDFRILLVSFVVVAVKVRDESLLHFS